MDKNLILVVDDDENTRRLLKFAFLKAGYNVSEAKTGEEALEFLKEYKPDLITLDIIMPDMDGYTLIKEIKNIPVLRNIPIIVSSGKSGMQEYFELEDEAFRPDAFISKPYKMKELIETVKKII